MYKAFHFKDVETFSNVMDLKMKNYKSEGEKQFNNQRAIIEKTLDKFYIEENILDGKKLMDEWFPTVNSHVFLSHSHSDIDFVYKFAGYLKKEFGISSFIDSAVWGYADDLLKKIDNKHCYKTKSKTYDYDLRNITTSNVYLMLNNALYNMIDKTECIIFINTPNSVRKISEEVKNRTYSPWIFSELNSINKIRKLKPNRLYKSIEKRYYELNESVQIAYDISEHLDALNDLTFRDIKELTEANLAYPSAEDYLDTLYEMKGWIK